MNNNNEEDLLSDRLMNLININNNESNSNKNTNNPSVDSLLIHNTPSPPQSYFIKNYPSLSSNVSNYSIQQQPINYRKVRPEPISDKNLVSSVVGFFQDVVGGDVSKHHHHSINQNSNSMPFSTASSSLSSQSVSEIKEQIEWLHFEHVNMLLSPLFINTSTCASSPIVNSNILLVLGYKTGFSVWSIDMNGVATEALSIKEPNITHVKLLQLESTKRILIAICKLMINDDPPQHNVYEHQSTNASSSSFLTEQDQEEIKNQQNSPSSHSYSSSIQQQQQLKKYKISILNLLTGECLHETVFNGNVIELKSNQELLCVNSWNRIDAFDLFTFEHRFSITTCYSQQSKSTGQIKNPISLGQRWLAFADNKYHNILGSVGGVSTGIEQSYTSTVLNTAKSISKGLVTVVNSVVSKSKSGTHSSNSSSNSSNHSPRTKTRHDSKDEYQSGIVTIIDTKKYVNNAIKQTNLHDENQKWLIAHFMAHHEPIYALEFNNNGRLLCTADILGQYFHVFQINANAAKSTRTVVKHLYSLHRGDTNAKLRNISFSNDSRWLAISTKRGTTHIFPINSYGGPVNARTHSKPFVVNRTSKHQRTAGISDQDQDSQVANCGLNLNDQMQQMLQQNYDNSCISPILINNLNPKLKSFLEPYVIPAYGQLKQPNANSPFQSSIISANANQSSSMGTTGGLLTAVSLATQQINNHFGNTLSNNYYNTNNNISNESNAISYAQTATSLVGLAGSNLAASAAIVTENVTNFASNTTNMIQYDNVTAISIFAESRGYLTPDEPRDLYKLKPANSLFVISDVNGNLVEYVLDVIVDASKSINNKPSNDSPIQIKITPKAQWPLQRIITSDELNYPIHFDNPLVKCLSNSNPIKKLQSDSFSNFNSLLNYQTAPQSFSSIQPSQNNSGNNDWIRQIEVNTHMGPHRRLFMGPQFVFKTFNSNLTTTMLNPTSSSVMSDVETPIVDLAGNLELNSLDISSSTSTSSSLRSSNPMNINRMKMNCTPTFIEVGAGSFQEGMPVMCGRNGSQKYINEPNINNSNSGNNNHSNANSNDLIESLADAMNESSISSSSSSQHHSPNQFNNNLKSTNKTKAIAIAISNNNNNNNTNISNTNYQFQTINSASSVGSNSSGVFTVGSYFMINPNLNYTPAVPNNATNTTGTATTSNSFTSSSNGQSSGSSSCRSSTNSNNDDNNLCIDAFATNSNIKRSNHNGIPFDDDNTTNNNLL